MEHFFEILKYTLPSLIVFATAYFILKKYLDAQYQISHLEKVHDNAAKIVPIKLQAYERLILLAERMRVSNAVNRLRSTNMSVKDLRDSLLISTQKEFEHNLAQKLYVSNKLWEILELAKNELLNEISSVASAFGEDDNSEQFAKALIIQEQQKPKNSIDLALQAIKEEAKIYLETS